MLTSGLQIAAIYFGPLQGVLKTQALTGVELAMCLGAAGVVFVAVEIEKGVKRQT